ncbi:MAG: Phosphoribosylamine--glycine ligase [Gemmatimonadaceae bacterium]|nr:Phosphoribosylamine--glycine ligase [Gemmatimonadaceae bacterium]
MKVLIVGSGGREHAIVRKLRRDDPGLEIVVAPGNPGVARLARCAPIPATDIAGIADFAKAEAVDLVVVGPEAPLAAGLADRLGSDGIACFGPTAAAAKIESSKRFAKEVMLRSGVPTAFASWHTDEAGAKRAVRDLGAPIVIKASGLAAGKGVFVCQSVEEADRAIELMLQATAFGAAGTEILVEEFMSGEELSLFFLTDGENFLPLIPAQDHKRLLEHDLGPNTGGMGAYAPVSIASAALIDRVGQEVVAPTLDELRHRSTPFRGLLYAGLMLTETGPKVVEFNCRFGDPETEAVLPLMTSPLLPLLAGACRPDGLTGVSPVSFSGQSALTIVVASPGYPEAPRIGREVSFATPPAGALVFHAGTVIDARGVLRTSGGRVFAITGIGDSMSEAQRVATAGAESVSFDGAYWRHDIGWREMARHARTS